MSLDSYQMLPESRAKRRVVFVLDRASIEWLEASPDGGEILDREDVAVLFSGLDLGAADPVTRNLDVQSLLIPDQVLVASPFRDGNYAPLEGANARFWLEKWSAVSMLCSYLGAKSVSVKEIEMSKTQAKWEVVGGLGASELNVEATSGAQSVSDFLTELTYEDFFAGGAGDPDRAREHLTEWGLGGDPVFRSLVDARSNLSNPLKQRKLVVHLSQESERVINVALSISAPGLGGLQAKFSRAQEDTARLRLTLDVVFPD